MTDNFLFRIDYMNIILTCVGLFMSANLFCQYNYGLEVKDQDA